MDEVGGALVAIALVLIAVFVPAAFISGISGQFYRQFALTIATATLISLFVSLTLSPGAVRADPASRTTARACPSRLERPLRGFGRGFNRQFDRLSHGYGQLTAPAGAHAGVMLIVYVGLLALTGWRADRDADRLHPGPGPGPAGDRRATCRPARRWTAPTRSCASVDPSCCCRRRAPSPPRPTPASTRRRTPPRPTPARSSAAASRSPCGCAKT